MQVKMLMPRIPAIATAPITGKKRPIKIIIAQLIFHHGVLSPKPSKPLPFPEDV